MKKSSNSLTLMLSFLMMAFMFVFTACSDDNETEVENVYTYGFSKTSASTPEFLTEMGTIEDAFKSSLGVTASPFKKTGATEECDNQVIDACDKAFQTLKDKKWQGDYTLDVTNQTSGEVVYQATFASNGENSGLPRPPHRFE